ncbi:hypothetical protein QR680_002029 [Steinernema hermaphroditum]|uniref:Uncharacterized protein n=1 Tax=Steinernema hermaphroditum TaxID=289476 RepID=A0AA39H3Q2_9BILA|nr:hypothetical protein QR680_002029 [Steinernema hermaphroditum]
MVEGHGSVLNGTPSEKGVKLRGVRTNSKHLRGPHNIDMRATFLAAAFLLAVLVTLIDISEQCSGPCEEDLVQLKRSWDALSGGEDSSSLKRKLATSSRFWAGKRSLTQSENSGREVSAKLAKSLRFWGKRAQGLYKRAEGEWSDNEQLVQPLTDIGGNEVTNMMKNRRGGRFPALGLSGQNQG